MDTYKPASVAEEEEIAERDRELDIRSGKIEVDEETEIDRAVREILRDSPRGGRRILDDGTRVIVDDLGRVEVD